MVPKSILFVFLLTALVSSQPCPKFVCSVSLGKNICANRLSSMSFQLNDDGCEEDYYCTAAGVYTWALMSVTTSTYHCIKEPNLDNVVEAPSFVSQSCPGRQIDKDFRSSVTVVTCLSDNDCILRDGSLTACDCVFRNDGAGVCTPDISNMSIFQKYWDECGDDNVVTDEDAYAYWSYYLSMYTIMQSGIDCIDIFREVKMLNDLWDSYDSAALLTLTAWVALG